MNWFYEQKTIHGNWSPVATKDYPTLVDGHIRSKAGGGISPAVRNVRAIAPECKHLSLYELQELYGGDRYDAPNEVS